MPNIETAELRTAKRGDIVRFQSYALRVEADPKPLNGGTGIRLHGRTNIDGCPLVTRSYMDGRRLVVIERA